MDVGISCIESVLGEWVHVWGPNNGSHSVGVVQGIRACWWQWLGGSIQSWLSSNGHYWILVDWKWLSFEKETIMWKRFTFEEKIIEVQVWGEVLHFISMRRLNTI